jgi:hypothetical protein
MKSQDRRDLEAAIVIAVVALFVAAFVIVNVYF